MEYEIRFTKRAERDLARIFAFIHADEVIAARNWYLGLRREILTLEKLPTRCGEALESKSLRQLLYGNKPHVYRVIFQISERNKIVEILHIRHGARLKAGKKIGGS
jgi:plasmid stabilization system protein ParE